MLNLKMAAAALGILLVAACSKSRKKDTPQPAYSYHSLNNVEVRNLKPYFLDMNDDDEFDVYFIVGVVNDQEGTHAKFAAVGTLASKVLSIPDSVFRLNEGDEIPVLPVHPQEWNALTPYFCEVLLPAANPADTTWRGSWVAASKKYMGVQFRKGDDTFLGWVSLSVDTARDCMVLHDYAWRHVNAGSVKAGERQ